MKIKYVIGSLAELIIKIAAFIFITMFVVRTATAAYDYGFRVFAEEPMEAGEGRVISVSIGGGDSAKEVGEMLQERGLIRDANLFRIQELLSEHHGKIQPGIYDLNTSMTSEEMLSVMATAPEVMEELPGTSVPSVEEIIGIGDNQDSEDDGSGEETSGEDGEEGGSEETQEDDTGE